MLVRKQLNSLRVLIAIIGLSVVLGILVVFLPRNLQALIFIGLFAGIMIELLVLLAVPFIILNAKRLLRQFRWYHLLWLLVFLSGLVFRTRTVEDIVEKPLDPTGMFRVAFMSIVGIVTLLFLVVRIHKIDALFRGPISLLFVYASISMFSTLWSIQPLWTFYKALEYFIDVLLVFSVVTVIRDWRGWKFMFDFTMLLFFFLLLSVVIGLFLFPDKAIYPTRYSILGFLIMGVFPNIAHESIGQYAAILGIVGINRFIRYGITKGSKPLYIFVVLFSIILLILSQSRSAIIAFLVSFTILWWFHKNNRKFMIVFFLLTLVMLFTNADNLLVQYFLRRQDYEQFGSLSSRIYYWQKAAYFIYTRPILGFGAYTGGRFLLSEYFGAQFSSSHNTYVEVALGGGIVSLVVLVTLLMNIWWFLMNKRFISRSEEDNLRLEAILILSVLTVRSFFQLQFIWHPVVIPWLLVVGYVQFCKQHYAHTSHPYITTTNNPAM